MRNGSRSDTVHKRARGGNGIKRLHAQAMGLNLAAELDKLETRVLFTAAFAPLNHAPTERSSGTLAKVASQSYPLTITRQDLINTAHAVDPDGNPIAFLVTAISAGKGNLFLNHNGATTVAAAGVTVVSGGDTLTWTPNNVASGLVNAFSIWGSDGLLMSKTKTAISVSTRALPTVSMSILSTDAWETQTAGHPALIQLTRTGSKTQALGVFIMFKGVVSLAGKFKVTGPNGALPVLGSGTTFYALATFAAGSSTVAVKFEATEDNVPNPTLLVTAALAMDGSATPMYQRSTSLNLIVGNLHIVDSSDTISFRVNSPGIVEGLQNQAALVITRTAAPGGTLKAATLNLSFTGGTFSTASITAASTTGTGDARVSGVLPVTFGAGETTKTVFLSTSDNGSANGTQTILVTAAAGAGFIVVNQSTLASQFTSTVNVLNGSPTVTVAGNAAGIVEGTSSAQAFTLTRTAAAGHSLVGLDTKVIVTFGGTFGASSHGFAGSTLIDFGTAGATSITVPITSTDDGIGDGTKTITASLAQATGSDYTAVNVGTSATVNVLDSMPSVTVTAVGGIAEGAADQLPFQLTRTAAPGHSLVGVDTKVALAFSGTFAASSHGFSQVQVFDFGVDGATTLTVPFQSVDNQVGNGTQTLIATLSSTASGVTPFNVVGAAATVNVTDASPTITLSGLTTTASATGSTLVPGVIIVTRTGPTTAIKDVILTNSTGTGFGVEGVDFNLFANGVKVVNDVIAIPAGQSSVAVSVVPLDNHINDALKATLALPKNGAWNNGTTSSVTITLTNNSRPPVVGNAKVLRLVNRSGSLTLTFDDLVDLADANLASNEKGTLTLTLSTLPLGTAKLIKAGTTALTSIATGGTISKGDTLVWTAPSNTKENATAAFTIGATDGTVKSATTCEFDVTII